MVSQAVKDKFIQELRDAYEKQDNSLIASVCGEFFLKHDIPTTVTWHRARIITADEASLMAYGILK